MAVNILERLRARLAATDDPLLREMLTDRIAELAEGKPPVGQHGPVVDPDPAPEPEPEELGPPSQPPQELSGPDRTPYGELRDELERIYLQRRNIHGPGKKFRQAWDSDRDVVLKARGWTEDEFYAEMDRRRREQKP
jgi:hypothetical protein